MQNEKLQIVLPDGATELVLREGQAVKLLDPRPPVKIALAGTIGSVAEFIEKRFMELDQVNQIRSHIIVDREAISILLVINENDDFLRGTVLATIELHPKFKEFGINAGKNWEPNTLGQFFKMNRAFFPSRETNMDLVTKLKSFNAKISSQITKQKEESGSFQDDYSGVVTSNVPGLFSLKIPVFKGLPPEILEVEFYAAIDGRDVKLQLYSPGASQLIEELRDQVIDQELDKIRAFTPGIVIIEK